MIGDVARHPSVAVWETTRACDGACVPCRASSIRDRDPRELSTAEAYDLLDQVVDLGPGLFVLSGGDPLKRPDLLAIVRGATARGLSVAVAPSVTPLLTADQVARLADAGVCRIVLGLDGPDAAGHDGLRGVPGSFAATLRAIDDVRAAGVRLQVDSTVTGVTAVRLRSLGRTLERLRPALWNVRFVVPLGRARRLPQVDPASAERLFHWLYDWGVRTGLAVTTTAAPAFRRVVLERETARARSEPGYHRLPLPPAIDDGRGVVFVSHRGLVYPSRLLPIPVGDVRRDRLVDLYRWSPVFRDLRSPWKLEGKCGACVFQVVCGGSRARAYATTGDYFADDPSCAYEPLRRRADVEPVAQRA